MPYMIHNGVLYHAADDELYHYGVKGMRWGHRKARPISNYFANRRQQRADAGFVSVRQAKRAAAQQARATNKQARANVRQAKAEAKANMTPEEKAARAAKRKRALKIGAAVAGTALAAYGAYKVNQYVKTKNAQIAAKAGYDRAMKNFPAKISSYTDTKYGRLEYAEVWANEGSAARSAANFARERDNFRTAARNVYDYRKQNGRGALDLLPYQYSYEDRSHVIFDNRKKK